MVHAMDNHILNHDRVIWSLCSFTKAMSVNYISYIDQTIFNLIIILICIYIYQ